MGSKGSNTTQTSQTYQANPVIEGAANQAIGQAQSAASQPFQMPVAPVAGFSPLQQQAFNQYQALQGSAQPYYDTARQLYGSAAAPITGADVANYYNPMADSVTANLKDIFGQQNSQNTANLVQAAGGIGADRIAVGQANMAKEQGLAAGQTYANLYQQALQAAQMQKQMQAGAASGVGSLGGQVLQANLQGTGALFGAGQAQQQQTQAELNAPYQNQLARLAYPFQTAQYLAGITGSLAPALGGTTNGQTTAPSPSIWNQIAGIGTAAVGGLGASGAFGSNGWLTGGNALPYGSAIPGAWGPTSVGGAPLTYAADGGGIDGEEGSGDSEKEPGFPHAPNSVVPYIPLTPGAGHSGPLTGGINMQPAGQSQSGGGGGGSGGWGDIAKIATTVLPLLLKEGGSVPKRAEGGESDEDTPWGWGRVSNNQTSRTLPDGTVEYAPGPLTQLGKAWNYMFPAPAASFNDRFNAVNSTRPVMAQRAQQDFRDRWAAVNGIPPSPAADRSLTPPGAIPLPRPRPEGAPTAPEPEGEETSGTRSVAAAPPKAGAAGVGNDEYEMPKSNLPYPDALSRDWGQNAARSPWLALVNAGATMAATTGPLGTAIGKGILAGTKSLEDQRKDLRSEQELNDKAKQLWLTAKAHRDQYNKMTPYQRESLALRNKELEQGDTNSKDAALFARFYTSAMNEFKSDINMVGKSQEEKEALAIAKAKRAVAAAKGLAPEADGATKAPIADVVASAKKKIQSGEWDIKRAIMEAKQKFGVDLTPEMLQ